MTQGPTASIHPACLRTENLISPCGLDTPNPRFSWVPATKSRAVRGQHQTGYHIRVATDPAKLDHGKGDLWDTGEIASVETVHIPYGGRALTSRQQCHWTVRIRAEDGRWSAWSKAAQFSMGLLNPEDWNARWIGTGESFIPRNELSTADKQPPPDNPMPDPWFRRTLTLTGKVKRATAHVASIGYHELFVNGRKVGDAVLVPSVTDHSKRARYITYEIAEYLRTGENVIGLWLGTGWSIFPIFATDDKPRAPIVLGQFDFELEDGRRERLVTDDSWKTRPSPNRLLGVWYFMNFGGEAWDSNQDLVNWADTELDDAGWKSAVVFTPALTLSADKIEPNRTLTELRPIGIEETGPGTYRVDLGRNFAGWTEIAVHGQPGDRVDFQYSERIDLPMTHRLRSTYVIGPTAMGKFRNRFNYSAGRWITIRGLRYRPSVDDVRGWLVRNDFAPASEFECSHPLFNDIYRTTVWTLENLMLGGYIVDCPQRERMGYGGDGHATITTALNVFSLGAFCSKWAEDWRDVQGRSACWGHVFPTNEPGGAYKETGNLPYTAPTYWGGGGPIWSGFCVHLTWETYRRYGDVGFLHENYRMIELWLGYLEGKTKDNLLQRWGGTWDFLGDWLPPEGVCLNSDTRETLFLNNCYWIYNLQVAADIAQILDHQEQASRWRNRARVVRESVHAAFFNPAEQCYVSGSQAELAVALLAEVAPPSLRSVLWKRLEHEIMVARNGHIHAGITGGALLFKLLMESGRDDLIFSMVEKETFPSWGHMLRQGTTTIWEAWSNPDSLLHSSFIYVGAWFIHGILGIQPHPQYPGFNRFIIRPGVPNPPTLTSAKGHYDSIRGRIAVEWNWSDECFELWVEVPPNTIATVAMPTSDIDSVVEGKVPVSQSTEIKTVRSEDNRLVLEVESGRYRFTSTLKNPCLYSVTDPTPKPVPLS